MPRPRLPLALPHALPLAALALALAACGGGHAPPSGPAASSDPPPSSEPEGEPSSEPAAQARRCLPVLNGCGCADRCGDGFQQADGSWGVVRPLGDSATDRMTVERRCFDARGVSYPEGTQPAEATHCVDVFYDQSACGGECIPHTDFLRCVLSESGSCGPRP